MSPPIEVKQVAEGVFQVDVTEGASKTTHRVTLRVEDYNRIAQGKVDEQELIRHAFVFLLAHEPKESILAKFDFRDISRYFPNFEREIKAHP